ncbi:MAG TPA: condensation domain-containing protein, partial [Pyrinomonadaceae bacterium]
YGPTECTTFAAWHLVGEVPEGAATVPIGRPLSNTELYVLDGGLRPVPVCVAGELYIGGPGLARGYLNRPGLTAEKFIPHPFSAEPGARLYRTGDVVRYLPGGEVEFIGRTDHQVKIRGHRIELGEVEAALREHASVREAVVALREMAGGERRLVAYVVGGPWAEAGGGELRAHLRGKLPEYMLPSAFVMLEELPLLPSGKVDRRRLPDPELTREQTGEPYVAPRTALEEAVAGIWSEVLGLERVGVHDDFFELGGHSLLATQVVVRVRDRFAVPLALRCLFEAPTVAGLSAAVVQSQSEAPGDAGSEQLLSPEPLTRRPKQKAEDATSYAPPIRRRDASDARPPLSFAQQRLWFVEQLEPCNVAYNIPLGLRLSGRLNLALLERCLSEIQRRHEILRTTFADVHGQPVQVIAPPRDVSLPVIDLSGLDEAGQAAEVARHRRREAETCFDLAAGPLWRAKLLRLGAEAHVALFTMHHAISDGWSMGVLVREMATLYEAFSHGLPSPLAELQVQYADYAVWQRAWLQGEVLAEQLAYWRRQLSGVPELLELPADRPRTHERTTEGAMHAFLVPREVCAKLNELARGAGATLFMVLLAAFAALLSRYSGQKDVPVGTVVAGRQRVELEPLIGFFVNTLVLRTDLGGRPSFRELLRRVRETTLGAYAHQDVPFEKLVEELHPERGLSHTPLFQAALVFQNVPRRALDLEGLRLEGLDAEAGATKFDLTLVAGESAESVAATFVYSTDIFEAKTVESMAERLLNLLRGAADEPDAEVGALARTPKDESRRLVCAFNTELE